MSDFIYDNAIAGGPEIVQISSTKPLWAHVFPQILNGLHALRQIGWVHRDLYPNNILIEYPEPRQITEIGIKIADFGCAREIGSIIQASLPFTVSPQLPALSPKIGQTLFRAPELATGYYDYKVDLFSAGIVLYFLSRYLPDKSQWTDEIQELRNNNRGLQHLSHKENMLITLIDHLTRENPNERPTADTALKYMRGEIKNLTEKKFLVKKQGDETYYRCTAADNSLENLQTAIQDHCHIVTEANVQTLKQKKFNEKEKILIGITSDEDVKEMFHTAERLGEKVRVVVTASGAYQVVATRQHVASHL